MALIDDKIKEIINASKNLTITKKQGRGTESGTGKEKTTEKVTATENK